jgi:hypothetical protein
MNAVCISMPMATMAWPTFTEAVAAAAISLGYQRSPVDLNSRGDPGEPGADERLSIVGEGCVATFSRDVRGKTSLSVAGDRYTEATLRALGEELSRAVVQQYIYRTLLGNIHARGFDVVDEEFKDDQTIRLKVRHGEN